MLFAAMSREKGELRPLLLKFGLVVALSAAGFLYSRLRIRKTKPNLPWDAPSEVDSRGNDQGKDDVTAPPSDPACGPPRVEYGDVFLSSELNDLVEEFDTLKDDNEQEIKHLRNMVRVLRERKMNLEDQLLGYYGLKEQETSVLELENRLKINNTETKLFTLKIASLQSENQELKNQVADHEKVVSELETAKSRIEVLKRKLHLEAEQNREQIMFVQKRVARLQEQELKAAADYHDIESKLRRLKALEGEAEELWKSNTLLQIENSELARKMESTQLLASSVLEDPETEALIVTRERLRQENEDLHKQMEQLREDRCVDAEELVYLRWLNACLRYELRNFQPIPGKTVARDLSKSLSPKSEEKAKKLILEYARAEGTGDRVMDSMEFDCDQWSGSQAFYSTDNGEAADDSPFPNSSAKKPPNSRKIKFFKNLRKLVVGKDPSTSKTDNTEDVVDSPSWSSGRWNDSINMLQSSSDRFTTPSQGSPTTSLDVDQSKDIAKFRRNSDCGPYGYKRFISSGDDASDSPLEHQSDQGSFSHKKSDVTKFAEALKQLETASGKIHKRAASFI